MSFDDAQSHKSVEQERTDSFPCKGTSPPGLNLDDVEKKLPALLFLAHAAQHGVLDVEVQLPHQLPV